VYRGLRSIVRAFLGSLGSCEGNVSFFSHSQSICNDGRKGERRKHEGYEGGFRVEGVLKM